MNGYSWLHHFIFMFCLACLSNESVAPQNEHFLDQELSRVETLSQEGDAHDPSEKFSDGEARIARPSSKSETKRNVLPTTIELYEGCRDRLELPESDNECVQDSDCSKGGCGSGLCIPTQVAKTMGSTCEVRPCFSTLDSCGCQAGKCQWTLKEGMINQP